LTERFSCEPHLPSAPRCPAPLVSAHYRSHPHPYAALDIRHQDVIDWIELARVLLDSRLQAKLQTDLQPVAPGELCNRTHRDCVELYEAKASEHQEWREGSDPMTARQPGEGRQRAKVSPETGRCGERQRNQRLPSSISLQHRTPIGEILLDMPQPDALPPPSPLVFRHMLTVSEATRNIRRGWYNFSLPMLPEIAIAICVSAMIAIWRIAKARRTRTANKAMRDYVRRAY
jgi:hypothetical protein